MTNKNATPYVIPVFIPFIGCPNRCIFCNQNVVTGLKSPVLPNKKELFDYFRKFLSYSPKDKNIIEIAFFGGNFLGMDRPLIIKYLDIAKDFLISLNCNGGIRFSTRPDTITDEKLNILEGYPIRTIELGIQSMDDEVLRQCKRGHLSKTTFEAVNLIKDKRADIKLGFQIMPGLPGDNCLALLKNISFIKQFTPDYLRVYPTLVLKNTLLEKKYLNGEYSPLSLNDAVNISSIYYDLCMRKNIKIIRIGLPPEGANNDDIVAGPWHPAFGELVMQHSFFKKICLKIILSNKETKQRELVFEINPSFESIVRGFKNKNIKGLKNRFEFESILIKKDVKIKKDEFSFFIN